MGKYNYLTYLSPFLHFLNHRTD
uniref:Uncharacterized protein n=1 Tax=Anguilla anguilla TaxID=7936 RepID=A0A0E9R8A6_ANGAN